MKPFYENNDDNLNENSNNIKDISDNDCIYDYDSEPKEYNYDYSYTDENLNEIKKTREIGYPKSRLDKVFDNQQVIKKEKSNKKSIIIFFGIAALIFTFGIYKVTSKDTTSSIVDTLPIDIYNFPTDSETIGTLPDGRNLSLYELPIEVTYDTPYKNTIIFLDMYDRNILFELTNIEDTHFNEDSIYAYDLDTREFKTILDAPNHQAFRLISDEYILFDTLDNIYLYNIKTEFGEYILPPNADRELETSLDINIILLKDTIFYLYKNTLNSYHIPTKETITLNLPENARGFMFLAQTNDYFLIEALGNTDSTEKSFLINKDNLNEIIPIPYEGIPSSIVDTEHDLIFPSTESNQDSINLSFNKKNKAFTMLEEDFLLSEIDFKKRNIYDDLIFDIKPFPTKESTLEIYSIETKETTLINLIPYIHDFSSEYNSRLYYCFADYVLIKATLEENIKKVYLILAE